MAYRVTKRSAETLAKMREARAARRIEGPTPNYPPSLPELRRRIVIEDFDFGHRVHVLELHRTNRIDCYRVVADGKEWKRRMGWSKILSGLRKSLPRLSSQVN
jgi:hypothetical protein